jgi:hypothetical protein
MQHGYLIDCDNDLILTVVVTCLQCYRDKAEGRGLHYDFVVVLDSTRNCQDYLKQHASVSSILISLHLIIID